MCPCCFVEFDGEPCEAMLCGHAFHSECLRRARAAKGIQSLLDHPCPTCKQMGRHLQTTEIGVACASQPDDRIEDIAASLPPAAENAAWVAQQDVAVAEQQSPSGAKPLLPQSVCSLVAAAITPASAPAGYSSTNFSRASTNGIADPRRWHSSTNFSGDANFDWRRACSVTNVSVLQPGNLLFVGSAAAGAGGRS